MNEQMNKLHIVLTGRIVVSRVATQQRATKELLGVEEGRRIEATEVEGAERYLEGVSRQENRGKVAQKIVQVVKGQR